ncbi:ATP-grasp fold amidoligase family protein [Pelagibacterium montanilacus]|uniref:ATP-grasp fold amidoligase family protein n=1 Tax=Pelagibacterium montanilacus TaxID=2185280 RepID=UPI0013DE8A83|nr:ATP-grasp fold amidoligase family protein [Pelagibacterium montanilacus]
MASPTNYQEMINWRKLFDRNPLLPIFSDKILAREWARARCPDLALTDIVWLGQNPRDIPEQYLKPGYVAKTTHGSSQNYFPDRESWDRAQIEATFERWLRYSRSSIGEWAYGQNQPRILVERLLSPARPVLDYSFRVHDGTVSMASVALGFKTSQSKFGYFGIDGTRYREDPDLGTDKGLPVDFEVDASFFAALRHAERLGKGVDMVRADFVWTGDELYFGELTAYPHGGFDRRSPVTEHILACWLQELDTNWFLNRRHSWPVSHYAKALRYHFRELAAKAPSPPSSAR